MGKIKDCCKNLFFILSVLILFTAIDRTLSYWAPVEHSTLFTKNDYEKIILSNGRKEFDNAFYGNSVVISAFIEEESRSGYTNIGIDYGTITDLKSMLDKGMLTVNRNLVLGLNYFVLMDTLDTNPTYPWHRKAFEPYVYFQRDRIHSFIERGIQSLLTGDEMQRYEDLRRSVYYGAMTDEELDAKIKSHSELFWGLGPENYEKNLAALEDLIDYCQREGIRLRAIWMPWNGYTEMPEIPKQVCQTADSILKARGIEVLDLTDLFPRECFHDLGHLNYEYGAHVFTEVIDDWLIS